MSLSTPDCTTKAADYITELRDRVEKLKERKRQLIALDSTTGILTKLSPHIEVQDLTSGLKAVKVNRNSRNYEIGYYNMIQLLEEEGISVLNAHLLPAVESEVSVHSIYLLLSV